MDANGSRYHLLLGAADWQGCRYAAAGDAFDDGVWPVPKPEVPAPAEWNADSAELMLRRRAFRFEAGRAENRPDLTRDRRGAAADRFGNWYWINPAGDGLRVFSAGSQRASDYWPLPELQPVPRPAFSPMPDSPVTPLALAGLAVTVDHFLLCGSISPSGLLVFDLFAGGAPRTLLWPDGVEFTPFDIAAAADGGAFILDRQRHSVWALDRQFKLARQAAPASNGRPGFEPGDGSRTQRPAAMQLAPPWAVGANDPVAIDAAADGRVFVLDRRPAGESAQVLVLCEGHLLQRLSTDSLRAEGSTGAAPVLDGYDMAYTPLAADTARLSIADAGGNQAFAFSLVGGNGQPWVLTPLAEYLPMRRFGGKGLTVSAGRVYYDFAQSWVPLVCQPQPRHEAQAWVLTKPFDGREPECVWHRLFIDGAIPAGCGVQVWSRNSDELDRIGDSPWAAEPPLYRRADGSEQPYTAAGTARQGQGTWELLLQRARGRYLQLRLRLSGNERQSPRLRALRVVYPRFSYLDEYLPAVYRDDADSAAFLDGFLANIEGFYTSIEDRLAAVSTLFDVSSAPAEALPWLASWLGVALDPAWDTQRRRLFIRHAMLFFQYRGTAHGLRLALSLALDKPIDETVFSTPERVCDTRFGVRLIEKYRTRRLPDVLFGDPEQLAQPATANVAPWSPPDGSVQLQRRYAAFIRAEENAVAEFPLLPPDDPTAASRWASFCETALGFTPFAAALERQAWQRALAARYVYIDTLNQAWQSAYGSFDEITQPDRPEHAEWVQHMRDPVPARTPVERLAWQGFLRSRYSTSSRLNAAYGSEWPALDLVPLPDRLPADGPALDDWFQFESTVLAMRGTAHRFTVLLPMPMGENVQPEDHQRLMDLARRIITLEKPAHTVFDLRFYWAMFRVGEARLGRDTLLDEGVRQRLLSPAVLGRGYLGQAYVAPNASQAAQERRVLGCD